MVYSAHFHANCWFYTYQNTQHPLPPIEMPCSDTTGTLLKHGLTGNPAFFGFEKPGSFQKYCFGETYTPCTAKSQLFYEHEIQSARNAMQLY